MGKKNDYNTYIVKSNMAFSNERTKKDAMKTASKYRRRGDKNVTITKKVSPSDFNNMFRGRT